MDILEHLDVVVPGFIALLFVVLLFLPVKDRVLNPRPEEPAKLIGARVTFFYHLNEEGLGPQGRVTGRVMSFDGTWYHALLETALPLIEGDTQELKFRAAHRGWPLSGLRQPSAGSSPRRGENKTLRGVEVSLANGTALATIVRAPERGDAAEPGY